MISLTYGLVPDSETFSTAFEAHVPRGMYAITLGSSDSRACEGTSIGDGEYTEYELYQAICDVASNHYHNDEVMSLVSSILETLGIEWI